MTTRRSNSRSTIQSPRPATPLIPPGASARREKAVLRRGRERLEAEERPDEGSARTSVAARRTS